MAKQAETNTTQEFVEFWARFKGHINFLEQSVRLGHNEEFKGRYDSVNDSIQCIHPNLQVEFGMDMMEGKVTSIVVTSREKGEGRKLAHQIVAACPEEMKELATEYRLPVYPWEAEVTQNWLTDMCAQFGLKSIAHDVAACLADSVIAVKTNPNNGKILIQVGFKNKREIKAVGEELVILMFDLLLGEQIISEAVELLSIKVVRDLSKNSGWEQTNGLMARDLILKKLL